MNARRGQVYNAIFECRAGQLTRLCPDRAITIPELLAELSKYDDKIYICGDGYDLIEPSPEIPGLHIAPGHLLWQNAYSVAMRARALSGWLRTTDTEFVPTYLRMPQAERERQPAQSARGIPSAPARIILKKGMLIMKGFKKVAIGSDHAGFTYKARLLEHLRKAGYEVTDVGCDSEERCHYPLFAHRLCRLVQNGTCRYGILVCGTGIGMSMAANKHRGIRAAVCSDEYSTKMTREHNDANVLCLGARVVDYDTPSG